MKKLLIVVFLCMGFTVARSQIIEHWSLEHVFNNLSDPYTGSTVVNLARTGGAVWVDFTSDHSATDVKGIMQTAYYESPIFTWFYAPYDITANDNVGSGSYGTLVLYFSPNNTGKIREVYLNGTNAFRITQAK